MLPIAFTVMTLAVMSSCAMEYEEFNILRFVEMKNTCPEGIDRCHCLYKNGTYVTGPFYYEDDPLQASLLYQTCNPDFCYCKDSPDVERDSRNVEMKAIMDVCPRNEMSRCLCEDNSVVKFPFDMTTLFQICRPKRCKCKNEKTAKKVTALGCKKGGFPWCPNTKDHKYFCKNGDTVFLEDLALYQIQGRTGCICKDRIEPRCKETGDVIVCPDGSYVDDSEVEIPGGYLDGCKKESWKF